MQETVFIRHPIIERLEADKNIGDPAFTRASVRAFYSTIEHKAGDFGLELVMGLSSFSAETPLGQIEQLADETAASVLEAIAVELRKRAASR